MNFEPIVFCDEQAETYVDLLAQQVLDIQQEVVTTVGLSVNGVSSTYSRDLYGRVRTVVSNHFTSIFGQEPSARYDNVFIQMSSFAEKLAKDHIFADGNKRTTVIMVVSLLSIQGIAIHGVDASVAEYNELYQWIQAVVTGDSSIEEMSQFLQSHAIPM